MTWTLYTDYLPVDPISIYFHPIEGQITAGIRSSDRPMVLVTLLIPFLFVTFASVLIFTYGALYE